MTARRPPASPLTPAVAAALGLALVAGACSPSATPVSAPTVDDFWALAAASARTATPLRVDVTGPAPGELHYEAGRSATVLDGVHAFVCLDDRAFDGQSRFAALPGEWQCGVEALVRGFRLTGQPLDAWSPDLPPDEEISESFDRAADGRWRWSYAARNPFVGGDVAAVVDLDPSTGRIVSARRTDPTGATSYAFVYEASLPAIRLP